MAKLSLLQLLCMGWYVVLSKNHAASQPSKICIPKLSALWQL